MEKPKGGRGKKAPYETVIVRVPEALVPIIERMCDRYRELVVTPDETLIEEEMGNLFTGR